MEIRSFCVWFSWDIFSCQAYKKRVGGTFFEFLWGDREVPKRYGILYEIMIKFKLNLCKEMFWYNR